MELHKIELLMRRLGIDSVSNRPCVSAALDKAEQTEAPAVAIELNDGRVVTGKTSNLLGASAAALLNAVKALADVPKEKDIISQHILVPIQNLKTENLGNHNPRLHTDEVLIALSVSAVYDDDAKRAMESLHKLKNTECHSTVILSPVDEATFRKLGVRVSSEPKYQTKKLYHN